MRDSLMENHNHIEVINLLEFLGDLCDLRGDIAVR